MKKIITTSQFSVYDDALSDSDHRESWKVLQHETYSVLPPSKGLYRVGDGTPLRCDNTYIWFNSDKNLPPEDTWYPRIKVATGFYASVIAQIAEVSKNHTDLFGEIDNDWVAIVLTPHLYKAGEGLAWHTDAFAYTGAFVYYAHPYWNCLWGGELLIVDETTKCDLSHFERNYMLDNEDENERIMNPGIGRYVLPKQNRIVFISAGQQHMLSKTLPAAGNNVRATLSGFFLRRDKAYEFLQA